MNSSMPTRQLWRAIGGIAGILGGLLFGVASLQQVLALDRAQSNGIVLTMTVLLAATELVLVHELARSHRRIAISIFVVLVLAAVSAIVGAYSLFGFGAVVGVGYLALGVIPWLVAAPVAAVLVGRTGLRGLLPPAVGLALLTCLVLVAGASGRDGLVVAAFVIYGLGWAWLGSALLSVGIRGLQSAGQD
jgi:hypothetical protein